ncbi:bacteriohemerythrin [Desulforhopalus sp. 52FAK]
MAVIKWRDSYSTGIEVVDDEHKKLVDLIEAMYTSIRDKEPKETVERVLTEIVEYTQTHFNNEEALMEEKEYPDLETHKAEHQNLIEEVGEYKDRLLNDFPDGRQELYRFLREWLINHIMESDKAFGAYVSEQV